MNSLLAVDLGTTTIVASLLDEATGERLASGMALNPQRQFGSDVVTRISTAVASEADRHEMSRLVIETLRSLALRLLSESGRRLESLTMAAIAGNPAMEHLLLDLPLESLARVPFRPLFHEGKSLLTGDPGFGIDVPLYLFPLPGGFVGGDLVAFLYGQLEDLSPLASISRLFLDIGTNAEIALVARDKIFATSAAAGPALEGGSLACGMPALSGAVSLVTISGEKVALKTVGDAPPKGVCGTGALSAVVSLLAAGIITGEGRLLSPQEIPSNLANRVVEKDGEPAFQLYRGAGCDLFLSQSDIRGIQLAKGAIRGGVELLLDRAGIAWNELATVTVSGSFGFSIASECLEGLGIIAPEAVCRVRTVPDGALAGVERFLRRGSPAGNIDAMAAGIKMLPLSGSPLFEKMFFQHMNFPIPEGTEP
ncbi:hypothetical protein OR1_01226 [Geobacter sp. OR-1]|uniref:ASKHA domain-containing protein n=1 Tax=Geobacter sp. OR-1 TaxID=1266765 RepID=UPI000542BCBC|nr:ASKHA domain-containing protein [Geobacter sp. OR-1]GAM08952.1 hypothetical protein OR1_01226 [Geobacter sp. OR-1]